MKKGSIGETFVRGCFTRIDAEWMRSARNSSRWCTSSVFPTVFYFVLLFLFSLFHSAAQNFLIYSYIPLQISLLSQIYVLETPLLTLSWFTQAFFLKHIISFFPIYFEFVWFFIYFLFFYSAEKGEVSLYFDSHQHKLQTLSWRFQILLSQ